jgi:hypothetical protein
LPLIYNTALKKYHNTIMDNPTTAKKVRSNFIFMTFFNIRNSGRDKPTTAIIKASQVPRGIHLAINACTMGITLVALAYMGIPTNTATGTAKGLDLVTYLSKNPVGTKP